MPKITEVQLYPLQSTEACPKLRAGHRGNGCCPRPHPSLVQGITWEAPVVCATRVRREPGSLPVPKLGCGLTSLLVPSWYFTAKSWGGWKKEEPEETNTSHSLLLGKNTWGSQALNLSPPPIYLCLTLGGSFMTQSFCYPDDQQCA